MDNSELSKLFNQKLIVKVNGNIVILTENDKQSKLKKIQINDIPNGSIVLDSDKIHLNTLFYEKLPINKSSDFLIITDEQLIFIEMKSDTNAPKTKRKESISKFTATECITDFIDIVIEKFGITDKFISKLQRKFILFYLKPSIGKETTSLKGSYEPKPKYNKPEIFYPFQVANEEIIEFSEL